MAADLVEALYRGLADDSVGKLIDSLLRSDLVLVDELGFAPLDAVGSQLLFRFVAGACERRSLGVGSHRPFDQWGSFLPEHTNAVSLLDRLLHHAVVVVTDGESFRMKEAKSRGVGLSEDLTTPTLWPRVRISGWPQVRSAGWPLTAHSFDLPDRSLS